MKVYPNFSRCVKLMFLSQKNLKFFIFHIDINKIACYIINKIREKKYDNQAKKVLKKKKFGI